jgi:hypothetical protein
MLTVSRVDKARAIRHEATTFWKFSVKGNRGQSVTQRKVCNASEAKKYLRVNQDKKSLGSLAQGSREYRVEIVLWGSNVDRYKAHVQTLRRRRETIPDALDCGIRPIPDNENARRLNVRLNSICLAVTSGKRTALPVMLLPGRARLSTSPA